MKKTDSTSLSPPADWPSDATLVDARGLLCPQPVLLASAAMKQLAVGERLMVVATDPHADLDLEVFCARGGHTLEARDERTSAWWFCLRKGSRAD